jgi:hypothetical protein
LLVGLAWSVAAPGFHFEGQTSPLTSANLNAYTSLRISSTFLPTGKSPTDIYLRIPLSSII